MKKYLICSALVCASLALFGGCESSNESSEPSSSVETSLVTGTETTEAETAATTTTKTTTATDTKAKTTATTAELTTEKTTGSESYAHRFEMMNTAFKTKSVPQSYYEKYETDPESVPERARKAIEENREMYGTPAYWCVDHETGNIFACVAYNIGTVFLRDYAVYRIDTKTGETFSCGDMSGVFKEKIPPVNPLLSEAYGLFAVGGKPVFGTYDGLFLGDEETDSIEVIDSGFEPQAGDMFIAGDKVLFRTAECSEDGVSVRMGVYDPNTKSLSWVDEFPDVERQYAGENLMWYFENSDLSIEGEEGGEQKIIFEWNDPSE